MTHLSAKIALGTVQFGVDYGVSNRTGRVPLNEARHILDVAKASGIDTLDTAQAYGDSETVLGMACRDDWQIYTKLPPVPTDIMTDRGQLSRWMSARTDLSLRRLRQRKLAGLMLHHPAQLTETGGQALFDALCEQRETGRTARIGISIYQPADLEVLPRSMAFDFVQGPLNLLDRRLAESGWIGRLADGGCRFFARSVFLQGLLLLSHCDRPRKFDRWSALWAAWDAYLAASGLTAIDACLRFVATIPSVEKIVVGVTSATELREVLEAGAGEMPPLPASFRVADPDLLDPSRWNML